MKKILAFVINEEHKILLLHNNPLDPKHGGDFWYTVTGGVEDCDNSGEDAAKREIWEETNLNVIDSIYLNWVFKYNDKNVNCTEYVYASFVEAGDIILNEENIEYLWCSLDDFVKQVRWFGDPNILKQVLEAAIKKELFFIEEQIEEYSFNFETINND